MTDLHPKAGNLKRLRELRGLTLDEVSKAVKLSKSTIAKYEGVDSPIPAEHLRRLSRVLYVPMSFFFSEDVPTQVQIPDFRTTDNKPAVVSSALAGRIARASELRSVATDIFREYLGQTPDLPQISINSTQPGRAADIIRQRFGFDITAYSRVENSDKLFNYYRDLIESNHVLVLLDNVSADGVRGFCLTGTGKLSLIFVNREGLNRPAQTWTLIHELTHVCIGKSGVSDPVNVRNKVEKYCNSVTAEILLPRLQFTNSVNQAGRDISVEVLAARLFREFKVSYYAVCLRLKELNLRPEASLDKFISFIRAQGFSAAPESSNEQNSPAGGSYKYLAYANLGKFSVNIFSIGVERKYITPIDFYRFTSVKPKWLPELREISRAREEGA